MIAALRRRAARRVLVRDVRRRLGDSRGHRYRGRRFIRFLRRRVSGLLLFTVFLIVVSCIFFAQMVNLAGTPQDALQRGLLLSTFIMTAGIVFLFQPKLALDASDFPRMHFLASLPFGDAVWFRQYLKQLACRWLILLFVSITMLVSLYVFLEDFSRLDKRIIALVIAAQLSWIFAVSLGLLAIPASLAERVQFYLRVIIWVCIGGGFSLVVGWLSESALRWLVPSLLYAVPIAWPLVVLHAISGGFDVATSIVALLLLTGAGLLAAAWFLRRLYRGFRIVEVWVPNRDTGYVIGEAAWRCYAHRRDSLALSHARESGEATSLEQQGSPQPLHLYRALDGFWEGQRFLGRRFDLFEKRMIAFCQIGDGGAESLVDFSRTRMLFVSIVAVTIIAVLLGFGLSPESVERWSWVGFLVLLFAILPSASKGVATAYRNLPLSRRSWLWPRIRFERYRMLVLLPPIAAAMALMLMLSGKPAAEIARYVINAAMLASLASPICMIIQIDEGVRVRWLHLSSVIMMSVGLLALALIGCGVIAMFVAPWPWNLAAVVVVWLAVAMFTRGYCRWVDRGGVDF